MDEVPCTSLIKVMGIGAGKFLTAQQIFARFIARLTFSCRSYAQSSRNWGLILLHSL